MMASREARGDSGGIVLVQRIGMFCNHIDKLLAQLWIWRVCLLGKGRKRKEADIRSWG